MSANNSNGQSVQRTYTAKEAADVLGVSLRTIYNLCETTKDFKVLRVGKRCLRIHKESFDKWFDISQGAPP